MEYVLPAFVFGVLLAVGVREIARSFSRLINRRDR